MNHWPEPNGVHEPVTMHNMYRAALPSEPYSGVKLCAKCGATTTALEKSIWVCTGNACALSRAIQEIG